MQLEKDFILINETGPRDGWQSHPYHIPTDIKIKWLRRILKSGVKMLNIPGVPNPKYIPQFDDTEEVLRAIHDDLVNTDVLIMYGPGQKARNKIVEEEGLLEGVRMTALASTCASTEHAWLNFHTTPEAMMERTDEIMEEGAKKGNVLMGAVICAFGNPNGPDCPAEHVYDLVRQIYRPEMELFSLADTKGIANPGYVRDVIRAVKAVVPVEKLNLHFHDASGFGLANCLVALDEGCRSFDVALGGMGGCPFVPGAHGNVPTEDFVNLAEGLGYKTGLVLEEVVAMANEMCQDVHFDIRSAASTMFRCNEVKAEQ